MKKKKRGKQNKFNLINYLDSSIREGVTYLGKLKYYLWFSVILFLIIALIGFVFPVFYEQQIIDLMQELVKQIQDLSPLGLISFIIYNNLKTSFFAVILGIAFGIIPLGITIVNAYILGFVANKVVATEGISILWRLLPHGIFELPAVLISVALGLRLGSFFFVYHGKNKKQEFWKWIRLSLKTFIFVVLPLLILAGIIEGIFIYFVG